MVAVSAVLLSGLAVVCLTDAGAQKTEMPAGAASVSDQTRIHFIKLTVTDATTNQPVAGAEVMCWESLDVKKVVTDLAGIATLSIPTEIVGGDERQRFDVTVVDPRYATRRVMWIATAGRVRDTLPTQYQIGLSSGVSAGEWSVTSTGPQSLGRKC